MQIRSVILYSKFDDKSPRRIDFELDSVNIITGKSNTGKSTVLQIVDYCLGKSEFEVCAGVTKDTVEWYAILLSFIDGEVFIAKPSPVNGKVNQKQVCLLLAKSIEIPAKSELHITDNDESLNQKLSRFIKYGISTGAKEINPNDWVKWTINEARVFLFQEKTVIANNHLLFHKQNYNYDNIRESLPYFLGSKTEEELQVEQDFAIARNEVSQLTRRVNQEEKNADSFLEIGRNLLIQAREVGLLEPLLDAEKSEDIRNLLETTLQWKPVLAPISSNETLPELRDELAELRRSLRRKQEEINSAKTYLHDTIN